jgi:hypothetical protein
MAFAQATTDGEPKEPFLRFQLVLWMLHGVPVALSSLDRTGGQWTMAIRWTLGLTTTGFLVSTIIAFILTRVPEHYLRGFRAALVVAGLSLAGGLVWSALRWALEGITGPDPLPQPDWASQPSRMMSVARSFLILAASAALFLLGLFASRMHRAREHAAHFSAAAHEAQLQLLRSQLNPHFLFNALNSVIGLILENPRAAQSVVRDIAALLRKALDADGTRDVPVQAELEFVRLYLNCEQVRFEERLQVWFEVEPGVEALRVPPMLLHLLVENAVKHGLRGSMGEPLRVRVSISRHSGMLRFQVQNTGTLRRPSDSLLPVGTGTGLRNLRERLAHLFPKRHALDLHEEANVVTARVELPALETA